MLGHGEFSVSVEKPSEREASLAAHDIRSFDSLPKFRLAKLVGARVVSRHQQKHVARLEYATVLVVQELDNGSEDAARDGTALHLLRAKSFGIKEEQGPGIF